MSKDKLYLVCPDCNVEHAIRQHYGHEAYFLTALGSVFDISAFKYAEEVNEFIVDYDINEIVIVNDIQCVFIRKVINKETKHETKAECELHRLHAFNKIQFDDLAILQQMKQLAHLNIYRQAEALLDVAFLGNKIRDHKIKLSGLTYNRSDLNFESLNLDLVGIKALCY